MIASGHPPSPRLRFGPRRRYGADLLSCSCELPPVGPRDFGVGKLLPNDLVKQLAEAVGSMLAQAAPRRIRPVPAPSSRPRSGCSFSTPAA